MQDEVIIEQITATDSWNAIFEDENGHEVSAPLIGWALATIVGYPEKEVTGLFMTEESQEILPVWNMKDFVRYEKVKPIPPVEYISDRPK